MQELVARLETIMTLKGKVLRREENQVDQDETGESSYYEKSQQLLLHINDTFQFKQKVSISGFQRGLTLPLERIHVNTGVWTVEMRLGRTALVLKSMDSSEFTWWYTEDGGPGVQYLDGKPWNRYLISQNHNPLNQDGGQEWNHWLETQPLHPLQYHNPPLGSSLNPSAHNKEGC